MSLTLNVAASRWHAHLSGLLESRPGLVPVVKGNGYGFGLARLALEAQRLGCNTLAIGTYDELGKISSRFDGDLVVLSPWRPFGVATEVDPNPRVIHTVGRDVDLDGLLADDPKARYTLELRTSMLRHGLVARELREIGQRGDLGGTLEGISIHLPLSAGSNYSEADRLVNDVVSAGLPTNTIWVSHLSGSDLDRLTTTWPDFTFRPRVGTDLWLGDRKALRVTATVLDAHPVERGDTYGYRGRTAPRAGTILVVSGGTAHGIGLEAPSGDLSIKSRAATLARGGLDAVGFVRSPYSIRGKQRLFAEPPHMQASMLFLPADSAVPAIGDEIDVRVRFTATTFDKVLFN
jgi:alanine racemase